MTAIALTISTQHALDEGVERHCVDLHLTPKTDDPAVLIGWHAIHVCFPVLVPGEDGRVIPFGRYGLALPHHDTSLGAASQEIIIENRDNGARIALSPQELMAVAQDPDVEII